jgi:hypothetical protein
MALHPTEKLACTACGRELDPRRHAELVCDGAIFCDLCHRYPRLLLLPRSLEELEDWNRRICAAFGFPPPTLVLEEAPPEEPQLLPLTAKLLMAEAHHGQGRITFYPPGRRLLTLCHELAHLMSGQDHTVAWARTLAALVAWVKERLPEDYYTLGFTVRLLPTRD